MQIEILVRKTGLDEVRALRIDVPDWVYLETKSDNVPTVPTAVEILGHQRDVENTYRAILTFLSRHGGVSESHKPVRQRDNIWMASLVPRWIISFQEIDLPKILG